MTNHSEEINGWTLAFENMGVSANDLDDRVVDAALAYAQSELNETDNQALQDDIIDRFLSAASTANNGGVFGQVGFLLSVLHWSVTDMAGLYAEVANEYAQDKKDGQYAYREDGDSWEVYKFVDGEEDWVATVSTETVAKRLVWASAAPLGELALVPRPRSVPKENVTERNGEALDFDVNEVHVVRCRLERDEVEPEQWTRLLWLNSEEAKAAYLREIGASIEPIDDSYEYCTTNLDSLRNFEPAGGQTLQQLRSLDTVRDR